MPPSNLEPYNSSELQYGCEYRTSIALGLLNLNPFQRGALWLTSALSICLCTFVPMCVCVMAGWSSFASTAAPHLTRN